MTDPFAFLDLSVPMAKRVAAFDWAATPLGPIRDWPPALKVSVAMTLNSGFAQCLCWGPDHIAIFNDAFVPILGNKGDCLGLPFSVIWHEAWSSIGPIAARALAGKSTFIKDFPLSVLRNDRGMEKAFFTFSYSPVADEAGVIRGFIDTVVETTDRVRFERRAAISNRELVHRMKNSYALVSAVVRQSARRAATVEDLTEKLLHRLEDMGQAQNILSLRGTSRATVNEVLARVHRRLDDKGCRFLASGPEVSLTGKQTFALTLAMFELATNAVKYGALSADEGRVTVEWSETRDAGARRLHLSWTERGGPPVTPPRHRGFGSFLVKQLLAAEFDGTVEVSYEPAGLHFELIAPLGGA
ncbi:sensor histidine kinase [Cereibacter johrii]|uniref:histidine kinase n=1 Tax=Cereibacter johrii TaxID=445629 RepID=A0ABX5JC88_9RHOB|nr:PAS domain-containing sensor histidine kinase [Cereibacter johrii]ODM42590.1 histidine kinase [Cereibacter johrii]PTM81450.1 two-component sensor histidine kinase [Cereibacter johrii]